MSPSWSVTRSGTRGVNVGHKQVWAVVRYQLPEVSHADQSVDLYDFGVSDQQFGHHQFAQGARGVGRHFHPDDFTAPAPFEGRFKFSDEIFGLFFEFEIAVAQ